MFRDSVLEQWLQCFQRANGIVRGFRSVAPESFDPQATWVAVAIGGAALIGGVVSSQSAASSAAAANKTNAKTAADTNALNYRLFQESRGSEGNALLPMYFGSGGEKALSQRAMQTYLAQIRASGTPEEQLAASQAIVQGMEPSMAASDQLVNQLFSGELENKQVQNIQPVTEARTSVAKSQKVGILEGLSARLQALSADRARAGYAGGGSAFQKNLLTGATVPALQAAGTVGAQADLANATDVANIRNAAIQTRLANLSLPLSQAANRIQLSQLPARAVTDSYLEAVKPFDWFKLQPSAFRADRPPLVTPVPGFGQIAGQAVASGASTLGNYYANRQLAQALTPQQQQFTVGDYMQQQAMMQEAGASPALAAGTI